MSHEQRLLTPNEAGQLLAISSRRVIELARSRQIPAVHLPNNEIRFSFDDLCQWIDTRRLPEEGR